MRPTEPVVAAAPWSVPTGGDLALAEQPGTTVTVYPDGPLVVRGDFVLDDVEGTVLDSGRAVALCRCGRSARKPYCDGSHKLAALSRARREGRGD